MSEERSMTVRIGNTRFYQHPSSGAQVPSVTTVLDCMNKPALVNWAANTTAVYAVDNADTVAALAGSDREAAIDLLKGSRFRSTKTAADRGTAAHELIEAFAIGDTPPVHSSMEWVRTAWEGLNQEFDIEIMETEQTVFNVDVGYAGSFDILARVNGVVSVVDVKTSNGIYDSVALQCCAYAQGQTMVAADMAEKPMPDVAKTWCLWVRPSGWALIPLKYDQDVWNTFRALVRLHKWMSSEGKSAVGKPINYKGLTSYRDKKFNAQAEAARQGSAA